MAIRKPVLLEWKNKKHRLTLTMSIIERVNNEVGLIKANRIDPDNFDFVTFAHVYSILFQECGWDVTHDSVYDTIFAVSQDDKIKLVVEYKNIVESMLPNLTAPIAKKKKSPKKKSKA